MVSIDDGIITQLLATLCAAVDAQVKRRWPGQAGADQVEIRLVRLLIEPDRMQRGDDEPETAGYEAELELQMPPLQTQDSVYALASATAYVVKALKWQRAADATTTHHVQVGRIKREMDFRRELEGDRLQFSVLTIEGECGRTTGDSVTDFVT